MFNKMSRYTKCYFVNYTKTNIMTLDTFSTHHYCLSVQLIVS